MTRKELCAIYGKGEKKIREWVRLAGLEDKKRLKPADVEKFIQVIGKPIKPSLFDRI